MIELGSHEMHGRAVFRHARLERLAVRRHAREQRQQRRVDIEHAPCVMFHEGRREDAHETGQHDQVGGKAVDHGLQRRIELFAAGKILVGNDSGRYPVFRGKNQSLGIGPVTDDGGNTGRPLLGLRRAHDRFHVAAASGNEDNDIFHSAHCTRYDGANLERPALLLRRNMTPWPRRPSRHAARHAGVALI